MHPLTFGERLALIRKRRALTQRALAERIGCQQSDIHRMEAGLVTDPHMSRLIALARVLDVSTDWLAGLRELTDESAPGLPVPPKAKRQRRPNTTAPASAPMKRPRARTAATRG